MACNDWSCGARHNDVPGSACGTSGCMPWVESGTEWLSRALRRCLLSDRGTGELNSIHWPATFNTWALLGNTVTRDILLQRTPERSLGLWPKAMVVQDPFSHIGANFLQPALWENFSRQK